MSKCPWCYEPAEHGVWTPRHGWHDLCQRHYNETSRDVVVNLLQKLEELQDFVADVNHHERPAQYAKLLRN